MGTTDSSYLLSLDGSSTSCDLIHNHLKYLYWKVISSIVTHFNSAYHISISIKDVCDNLLPAKPKCLHHDNEEAYAEYHEKLRGVKIRYEDVIDQIILLLGERSFTGRVFYELAEKCRSMEYV